MLMEMSMKYIRYMYSYIFSRYASNNDNIIITIRETSLTDDAAASWLFSVFVGLSVYVCIALRV